MNRHEGRPVAAWLDRHRRGLVAAYLGALALVCAVVLVPALRAAVTSRAQSLYEARQRAWIERVERAEELLATGDAETAAIRFARLDETFPARIVRHSLDRERERVLRGLGAAELALGRKGRALDAYRRAVAFDPRNVSNYYALATAAIALDEAGEAAPALERLLAIYPNHAGAVRAAIGLRFEDGDWPGVVERFERYVAAFRVHPFLVRIGEKGIVAHLPVDGLAHELRVGLGDHDAGAELSIEPRYPTVEIRAVRWGAPAVAGEPGAPAGVARPVAGPDPGRVRLDPRARTVWIDARAGIPVDEATLSRAETAYRNLLRSDRFAELVRLLDVVTPEAWDAARLEAP